MPANYPMPINAPSVILSATATTARVALTGGNNNFLVLKNIGSNPVFVVAGDSAVTATYPTAGTFTDGGTLLAAGEICTYSKDSKAQTHIAYICDTSLTSTLVVQVGQGV